MVKPFECMGIKFEYCRKVFREGFFDQRKGLGVLDNPHRYRSWPNDLSVNWRRGWEASIRYKVYAAWDGNLVDVKSLFKKGKVKCHTIN